MNKRFKNQNSSGITLIALIITIIVLLILAGVSISMVVGDNGILTQAGKAKEVTAEKEIEEEIKLEITELETNNLGKVSNSEIEDIVKKYDKDGKIKFDENREKYIETEEGQKIVVTDFFVGKDIKPTIRLASFYGETYKEIPILETTEKIELDIFEIKDSKLCVSADTGDGNVQSFEFDIHSGEYEFDYINVAPFLEIGGVVPSILVDSNWKVCSDLSGYLGSDDYHLIVLTSESDLAILQTSDYYTSYGFWFSDWYDTPILYTYNLVGTNGIYADINWITIYNDGEKIYDVSYFDEGFEEAKELAESLKNMDGANVNEDNQIYSWSVDYEDYRVLAIGGLYFDGHPVFSKRSGNFNYTTFGLMIPTTVFDATVDNLTAPDRIRNKTTLEDISSGEYLEKYEKYLGEDLEKLDELIENHEYYLERKFYAMDKGTALSF